ncbi:MAG: acyltransferase [Gemmatimonadetes bacterium]|nr:acyltransferase [Gemmatimonadota bacterium]
MNSPTWGRCRGGAGFVSNIRFWTQTNYSGPDVDSKPLLHLWSLGIEEQYYLLWPFALAFLWRGSHRVAPMVGLMVVSFVISLTPRSPTRARPSTSPSRDCGNSCWGAWWRTRSSPTATRRASSCA